MFCVFTNCCCLVVSTSAINCLERLVSEMTYYVLSGMLNPTNSTQLQVFVSSGQDLFYPAVTSRHTSTDTDSIVINLYEKLSQLN